jgi:hypothetical protein
LSRFFPPRVGLPSAACQRQADRVGRSLDGSWLERLCVLCVLCVVRRRFA